MKTNKIIRNIVVCLLVCVGMVAGLAMFAERPNELNNGFVRSINNTDVAKLENSLKLSANGFYLAGNTESNIFIAHINTPSYLLRVNIALTDSVVTRLSIPQVGNYSWKQFRYFVDSPHYYISEGVTPKIFQGTLPNIIPDSSFKKAIYFNWIKYISPRSGIAKGVSAKANRNMIFKMSVDSPYVTNVGDLLGGGTEGLFSTNGDIAISSDRTKIVYTYYYKNTLLCLDTNLNIYYKANTIDTNTHAKISVANTSESGRYIYSSPPKHVNVGAQVSDNKIYVYSALRADNEKKEMFKDNSVIDVYSLEDGHYLQSFYVPKLDNEIMREFAICGSKLIALYEFNLGCYALPLLKTK